jgi:thioredoxin reductase
MPCFYFFIHLLSKEDNMSIVKDIAIIGAGPYGMSLAAHLNRYPMDYHIAGKPMDSWRTKMPKGMHLKSAGFASNLSAPKSEFSLAEFCASKNIPYGEIDFPISLQTFCDYGIAFQQRFVPNIDPNELCALSNCNDGFELRMSNGDCIKSKKVVIAVGIDYFRNIPESLTALPAHLYSHAADHHDLERFRGRSVAVMGSGASAIDIAVLLQEAGAFVHHLVRKDAIDFGGPWQDDPDTILRRMRSPISKIGPGWKSFMFVKTPWLYRHLPDHMRLRIIKRHLGPSPGWFMRDRAASLSVLSGVHLMRARERGTKAELELRKAGSDKTTVVVDHVIAATGYENDVRRLPFLSNEIVGKLGLIGNTPRLSSHFESSIPGLYFIGGLAGTSFGPVMRFVAGADFASRKTSTHLARSFGANNRLVGKPARAVESP